MDFRPLRLGSSGPAARDCFFAGASSLKAVSSAAMPAATTAALAAFFATSPSFDGASEDDARFDDFAFVAGLFALDLAAVFTLDLAAVFALDLAAVFALDLAPLRFACDFDLVRLLAFFMSPSPMASFVHANEIVSYPDSLASA